MCYLLEYALELWNLYFAKDIVLLERVHRQFMKKYHNEDRLLALKLPPLKEIRERGDLIETFKIFFGHYSLPWFSNNLH